MGKLENPPEKKLPTPPTAQANKEIENKPSYKTHLFEGANGKRAQDQLLEGGSLKYQFFTDEKKEVERSGVMDKLLKLANISEPEKEKSSFALVLKPGMILESYPPKLGSVDVTFDVSNGGTSKIIEVGKITVSSGKIDFDDITLNLNNSQKRQVATFINLMPIGL